MKHSVSLLHITLICVCFGPHAMHASSEFNVTVQNSSTSPVYYVIATTNLTGKVLEPSAAIGAISTLGVKSSEPVPEVKRGGWLRKKTPAAPTPPSDTAATKRSKSSNRVTEYTQFFASTDKDLLVKRINGDPLVVVEKEDKTKKDEKKLVTVKRFPQSVKPYCTGTLSFTIKNKGVKAANQAEQAISVTSNDKGLTCTFFAPTQPAAAAPSSTSTHSDGPEGFLVKAQQLREREQRKAASSS